MSHDIPWDENFIVQPYLNKQFSITQAHSGSINKSCLKVKQKRERKTFLIV